MIDLVIYKDGPLYKGYKISGHANYARHGKDIVCAAVSILVQATTNGIDEILGARVDFEEGDKGYAKLLVNDRDFVIVEKASLLLETMVHGLNGIAEAYPRHIHIAVEEVKS